MPATDWLATLPQPPPPAPPEPEAPFEVVQGRPEGAGILAGSEGLLGVLMLLGGLGVVAVGGALANGLVATSTLYDPRVLGAALAAAGAVATLLGCAACVLAAGLWRGARWAWTGTVFVTLLGALASVAALAAAPVAGALGLAIAGGILYYLTRPGVEQYYQKVDAWPTAQVDRAAAWLARRDRGKRARLVVVDRLRS